MKETHTAMKTAKNQSVKKSAKNQVVMSKNEVARAKKIGSAYSSRRSSKPKFGTASVVEALDPMFDTRRAFYMHVKSDLYSPLAEPTYIVIDNVPHKRVGGKYVALKPKSTNISPEIEMYKQLLKLAGLTDK